MDIDPQALLETAQTAKERPAVNAARLNAAVAATVAVLATFMGICKVKDDNIVQGMQQAQADKLDHWAFYQARNLRQEIADSTVAQLTLSRLSAPAGAAGAYDTTIAKYQALASEQASKKDALKTLAEQDQKTYDGLNFRDDQFDLSDALIAIAIAMLAVTALTGLWALYAASLVPAIAGVLMGTAGLASWPLHPSGLIKLLS